MKMTRSTLPSFQQTRMNQTKLGILLSSQRMTMKRIPVPSQMMRTTKNTPPSFQRMTTMKSIPLSSQRMRTRMRTPGIPQNSRKTTMTTILQNSPKTTMRTTHQSFRQMMTMTRIIPQSFPTMKILGYCRMTMMNPHHLSRLLSLSLTLRP